MKKLMRVAAIPMLLPVFYCVVCGCAEVEESGTSQSAAPPPTAVNKPDSVSTEVDSGMNAAREMPTATAVSLQKASAEKGWGDISGQIIYDGDAPEPTIVVKKGDPAIKDTAVCAAQELMSEELLVDPETNGVANVFVFIHKRIAKGMKIHPEAAKLDKKEIVFDQKNCRFIPHVMVVRTGQTVVIKSDDNIAHNTHTTALENEEFNTIIAPNDREGVRLDNLKIAESLPLPVKCSIHPWMKAHWLVIDHPYATVTDEEGRFTIENLPVGEVEFRVWHERVGYIDTKYAVTVKDGKTGLEPVLVPAEKFGE